MNFIAAQMMRSRRFLHPGIKRFIVSTRGRMFDKFSFVYIETIASCNRKCPYCPNSKSDRGSLENRKKMEVKLFHKIINELSELGWIGELLLHFYGEPLLDERLPDFVSYAKSRLPGSPIAIYTNGDFLTVDLYKKLVKSGVTDFLVTQHQREELNTVKELLEYRKNHGKDKVGLRCKKLNWISSRGGLIQVKGVKARPKKVCVYPLNLYCLGVNYAGEVIFCCEDYFNEVKLGNIEKEKLINIWNSSYYKQLRNEVSRGVFKLDLCKKCSWGKNPFLR